jgi:hypothetical protein
LLNTLEIDVVHPHPHQRREIKKQNDVGKMLKILAAIASDSILLSSNMDKKTHINAGTW